MRLCIVVHRQSCISFRFGMNLVDTRMCNEHTRRCICHFLYTSLGYSSGWDVKVCRVWPTSPSSVPLFVYFLQHA